MANGGGSKKRLLAEAYVFVVLALISFSMLLFSTRDLVMNFRDSSLSLFSGVRGGVSDVSSIVSRTVMSAQELFRLRAELDEALEQIARYERLERSAAEIFQENARLREQLGFSESLTYRRIPARLVARDPDNLYSALVINKGSKDGVARNMAVIALQGGNQALVGKVIEARSFESLVMPVYDASLNVASRFASSRFEGIVEGQGDPEMPLRMRFIARRAMDEINHGDLVTTSGIGKIYPPDISIGRVSGMVQREYEATMEAELESLIDFSRLEYVFVIEEISEERDSDD